MTDKEKFIAITNNDCVKKSDAIIILEGDGKNRYRHAVNLFHQEFANLIVFSGGITDYRYGSYPFEEINPLLLESGVPESQIIYESKSLNTRDQAIEIIQMALLKEWKRIIIVASHYHQYRAYLTFIKEIANRNCNVIVYNSPASGLKWFEETGWGQRFNLLDQEFERIQKYTEQGHLATFAEAIDYQKWKEQQL